MLVTPFFAYFSLERFIRSIQSSYAFKFKLPLFNGCRLKVEWILDYYKTLNNAGLGFVIRFILIGILDTIKSVFLRRYIFILSLI